MKKKIFFGSIAVAVFVLNIQLICNRQETEDFTLSLMNVAMAQCVGGENGSWEGAQAVMTIGIDLVGDSSCPTGIRVLYCSAGDCVDCVPGANSCTERWSPTNLGCE